MCYTLFCLDNCIHFKNVLSSLFASHNLIQLYIYCVFTAYSLEIAEVLRGDEGDNDEEDRKSKGLLVTSPKVHWSEK